MGLNSPAELRSKIFKKAPFGNPNAFKSTFPDVQRCVYVNDLLTKTYANKGPRGDYTFTVVEACEQFYKQVRETLDAERVQVYILCMDQEEYMNPDKTLERKRRAQKRKGTANDVHPYPEGAVLTGEGIRIKGRLSPTFHMTRLMRARSLRPSFWRLLLQYIIRQHRHRPTGTQVVFDHFMDGAKLIDHNGVHNVPNSRHLYGEADMGMPYWLNRYGQQGRDMVVCSTDSDQFPILMYWLYRAKQSGVFDPTSQNLYWHYGYGNYCNVAMLYNSMFKPSTGWSARTFVNMCVLIGTDYVQHEDLWYGIGSVFIWKEAEKHLMYLLQATDADTGLESWTTIVRYVYAAKLKLPLQSSGRPPRLRVIRRTLTEKANRRRAPGHGNKRHMHLLSDTELIKMYDTYVTNVKYWTPNYGSIKLFPRTPAAPDPAETKARVARERKEAARALRAAREAEQARRQQMDDEESEVDLDDYADDIEMIETPARVMETTRHRDKRRRA